MSAQVVHEQCHKCGRLLVRNAKGTFPPHRVPPPTPPGYQRGKNPMVRLTGSTDPWCRGGSDR